MKAKIDRKSEVKEFKGFKLTLDVETIEEARLLFHVFNYRSIRDRLFTDDDYVIHKPDSTAPTFDGDLWIDIEGEILRQGFRI